MRSSQARSISCASTCISSQTVREMVQTTISSVAERHIPVPGLERYSPVSRSGRDARREATSARDLQRGGRVLRRAGACFLGPVRVRATVDRLELQPGAIVLDACAGSGASALPAAERVGPSGKVIAVDLADNLLALARTKADRLAGIRNLETHLADIEALEYPSGAFDAVIIVFGVFFLPDMAAAMAALWRLVGPGGQLAVTTWGPRLWEPANSEFWDAVDHVRPDLTRAYTPWEALTEPEAVRALLARAGAEQIQVEAVAATHPLRSPRTSGRSCEAAATGPRTTRSASASRNALLHPVPRCDRRPPDHHDRDERRLRPGAQEHAETT